MELVGKGARGGKVVRLFHGKRPGSPQANCPQIHSVLPSGRPQGGLLSLPEVRLVGRLPAERLMRAAPVVPVEAGREARLLRASVRARAQIHPLVLDGPPQPLDEDVVVAATAAVHADGDTVVLEHPGEGFGRELAALIGVEDLGRPIAGNRLLERGHAEANG